MNYQGFRTAVVAVAVFSQIFLLYRIARTIWFSRATRRLQIGLTLAAGLTIGVLFLMNLLFLVQPIPWVDPPRLAQWVVFDLPAVWSFGSIWAALLLLSFQVVGLFATALTWLYQTLSARMDLSDPPDPDRRRFLKIAAGGLAVAPFAVSGYGVLHESRAYQIKEVHLPLGRTLRIVQLTDIHAGIYMSRSDMRRYAEQVMELQPDLFVLTGDYISDSIAFLPGCLEEMSRVRAKYGTFAIPGNHDLWHAKLALLRRAFKKCRMSLLVNRHKVIETEEGPFAVVGIDDMRSGFPNLGAATKGLDPTMPAVLLSHRPEIFPEAAERKIPLTLAGHYHGGQIKVRLPEGEFSLAHLRTPYVEGLHRIGGSYLYVSAGIGTTFTPVRLNAPPEITVVNLT